MSPNKRLERTSTPIQAGATWTASVEGIDLSADSGASPKWDNRIALDSHKQHHYTVQVKWTGNRGDGTSGYRTYSRNHEISAPGKPALPGSSDPTFHGDPERYNPEELLVSSLSTCHMLWYLHLCAEAKIVVLQYVDEASGVMAETSDGGGRFTDVVLKPQVVIAGGDLQRAEGLHERAHHLCFIANSVNFPVRCEAQTRLAENAVRPL